MLGSPLPSQPDALLSPFNLCLCSALQPTLHGIPSRGPGHSPWPAQDQLSRPQVSGGWGGCAVRESEDPEAWPEIWAWLGGPRQAGNEGGPHRKPRGYSRLFNILLQAQSPSCSLQEESQEGCSGVGERGLKPDRASEGRLGDAGERSLTEHPLTHWEAGSVWGLTRPQHQLQAQSVDDSKPKHRSQATIVGLTLLSLSVSICLNLSIYTHIYI